MPATVSDDERGFFHVQGFDQGVAHYEIAFSKEERVALKIARETCNILLCNFAWVRGNLIPTHTYCVSPYY